jgi:hypothetical protein
VTRRILSAALAATLLGASGGSASAAVPESTIELRVFAHAAIDAAALHVARTSVTKLLGSAGIRTEWRTCPLDGRACRTERAARSIAVRLVPTRAANSHVCGCVIPDDVDGDVVMFFLPCHEDQARIVRANVVARSEPSLATFEIGHLIGLTMAHEIGHVLGLAHAAEGVMQARFAMEDLRKLRLSELGFIPRERLRMRQAMMVRAHDRAAATHRTGGSSLRR